MIRKQQRKRTQKLHTGDIFCIPDTGPDGASSIGQIIDADLDTLNSVLVALTDLTVPPGATEARSVPLSSIIAVPFVTADQLQSGAWPLMGHSTPPDPQQFFDLRGLKQRGLVGATIRGSAVVANFLRAFHGRIPWDFYYRPDYLDGLLVSPDKKPKHLLWKHDLLPGP